MLEESLNIKTRNFDGPLALLLMLIQKEQLKIKDLDITLITKQYIQYIHKMKELNFDLAGDFLYMASTLLYLKSKYSLGEDEEEVAVPNEEVAITSKEELIARLQQLQRFQALGKGLWALQRRDEDVFVKPKIRKKDLLTSLLTSLELNTLTDAMVEIIKTEKRSVFKVEDKTVSIKEKLAYYKTFLKQGETYPIEKLYENTSIPEIVVSFVALLELARLGKLQVVQPEDKAPVQVAVVEDLTDFDLDLATGYDDEDAVAAEKEDKELEKEIMDLEQEHLH